MTTARQLRNKGEYKIDELRVRAVVGCKLDSSKLFIKKKVRTCDHDFPEDVSRHPETGMKLWTEIEAPISQYRADAWPRELREGEDNILCRMVEAEDGTLIAMTPDEIHVQVVLSSLFKAKMAAFPKDFDLKSAKRSLQEILEPFGLWDESKFGVWAVVCN